MTGWQSKVTRKKAPRKGGKAPTPWPRSVLEETLDQQLRAVLGPLNRPKREYRFAPPRMYRADFAWPERMLLVEVEGGIWTNGRHSRGAGMEADMEKYNLAASLGWAVLRFGPTAVKNGNACRNIEAWFKTTDLGTWKT